MLIPQMKLVNASELSEDEAKQGWEETIRLYPDLWRRCYPKIYEDYKSDQYYSPKTPARQMFASALKIELGYMGQSEKFEMAWASRLAAYKTPIYWVARDLLEAVKQTVPPVKLDWYNMPMPFPAAVFMLPKGSLVHPTEGDARFISYNRTLKGEEVASLARSGPRIWQGANGAIILFASTPAGHFTHWNIPYKEFPVIDLADINGVISQHEHHVHTSAWVSQGEMTHDDTIFGVGVAHLLFGLLLLMTRKAALVEAPQLLRRVQRSGEAPKEFWSPGVIGRNYKIKRMVGPSLGGTHASPRGHWVRGFWREQLKGVGRSIREDIWIEPYWRGGEENG